MTTGLFSIEYAWLYTLFPFEVQNVIHVKKTIKAIKLKRFKKCSILRRKETQLQNY